MTLGEIGREVNGKDYAAAHMAIKRLDEKLKRDKSVRKTLSQAAEMLNVEMSP